MSDVKVDHHNLDLLIESILFVATGPVSIGRLASTLDTTPGKVKKALEVLEADYEVRGLRLQLNNNEVQLTTAPENTAVVEKYLGIEDVPAKLSQAALEVLSIAAYMQPVTRPQIDQIRGVNSDGSLRNLLSKGLLEEVGRSDAPGRPILYGTSPEFLQHFGLGSLSELLPLPEDEEEVVEDPEEQEEGTEAAE